MDQRDISRSVNIFAKNIQKDVILTADFLLFLRIYLKKRGGYVFLSSSADIFPDKILIVSASRHDL